jgi:hypothetical protein
MKQYFSFSEGSPGCMVGGVNLLLSIALMFSTIWYVHPLNYLRPGDLLACGGRLGAGYPVSFLCDYSGGGSPISSAGRIDWADLPYFSPLGTLVDLLFYGMQVWLLWFVLTSIFHKGTNRAEQQRWATLIAVGYVIGFCSALLLLQTVHIQIDTTQPHTPTPVLPSPTPFGTLPPPPITPSS